MNEPANSASHVLVIDDEPAIRRLIVHALEEEGYAAIGTASGSAGLAQAAEAMPSMVLLDLMMPEMDGEETLRHLRELPGGAELPVVLITAAFTIANEVKGVQGVLLKPFDIDDLLDAVERFTSSPEAPHQTRSLTRER
jgi:CheY-like chemotaxis protein